MGTAPSSGPDCTRVAVQCGQNGAPRDDPDRSGVGGGGRGLRERRRARMDENRREVHDGRVPPRLRRVLQGQQPRRGVYEAPRLGRGDGPEAGGQAVQRPSQARRRFPSQAMTTSPRAVIFDFGGVIWNMEWEAARALEAEHGLPQGSLRATLYDGDAWSRLQRGRGDRDAWLAGAHRALEQVAGRPLPPLHAQWRATHGPIAENIALIRVLRPRHRTSILSNSDTTLRERLGKVLGIAGLFDDIVCSAEIGLVKPEPEIYALACDRRGPAAGSRSRSSSPAAGASCTGSARLPRSGSRVTL